MIPKYTRKRENSFPESMNLVESDDQWILFSNF